MSMERSRRARFTNVAPTAGEFTVAVLLAGLFFLLGTPLVVQGIVGWAASGELALPNGHLLDAYGGLLHGQFGAGLHRDVADALPSDAVMWVLAALGEVLVLGAAVVVGMWMRDLTGTSSEARPRHPSSGRGGARGASPAQQRRGDPAGPVRPLRAKRSRRHQVAGSQ